LSNSSYGIRFGSVFELLLQKRVGINWLKEAAELLLGHGWMCRPK
jgi:hypothetical protein